MTQEDIINLLKELFKNCKKQFPEGIVCLSKKDISEQLSSKVNKKNVEKAITQLKKFKEIESIQINVNIARKLYGKNINKEVQLFFIVDD